MGKKPTRKPLKKLPDTIFLEGARNYCEKPDDPDGIILPTAPSSKILAEIQESTIEDGSHVPYENYNREMSMPLSPPYTAFLGNLSPGVTCNDIAALFKDFDIKSIRIPELEGRAKRFGYVELPDASSLCKILNYNGEMLQGRPIKVDLAAPQKNTQRGGYGRNDYGSQGSLMGHPSQYTDVSVDVDNWRSSGSIPSQEYGFQSRGMDQRSGSITRMSRIDLDEVETFRSSPGSAAPPYVEPLSQPAQMTMEPRQVVQPSRPKVDPFGGAVPRDENNVRRKRMNETSIPADTQNQRIDASPGALGGSLNHKLREPDSLGE